MSKSKSVSGKISSLKDNVQIQLNHWEVLVKCAYSNCNLFYMMTRLDSKKGDE